MADIGTSRTTADSTFGGGRKAPEATWKSFAPRGSVREPYKHRMPVIEDYTVTACNELWADNVITLYEEAKARQWNATRDIPWTELEALLALTRREPRLKVVVEMGGARDLRWKPLAVAMPV